ncbi:DUF3717 domain-containing protein [Burkholderia sp. SIMBA_043]|uniref:DUF3717 domain-containing protein n=1 Tax=Burkholderia TaxID=32008 RepID=UPI0005D9AA13|nr:DUF3717 domain-containing protein [Burkholderia vietnamiensis]AJY03052.1 hypothetical protein AK36_6092 [Burkholderia vietnamiensis LMG 10929]AVR13965.1 DUF3717 domain-containing protein [Burkholderia vietnamiensis]KVM41690.1 hypothetical protein WJ57_29855 [Burkholderia vietnamiensis]KVS03781.1 hypothetical protein WK30_10420 [Burkholderia vietnamiensis]UBI29161.1 DUF3717 domain-containing protein [Burkholderia vietnamiensis]
MFTIAELEAAINHVLAKQPSEEFSIPVDARRLGDVYGAMIWNREESRALSSLSDEDREVFECWKII